MRNFIENISIKNFKSLQSCEIKDCKRINLFIGRPNVGKSNIIEALSLFTIPYLKENKSKKLTNLIRLENESELFYNGNFNHDASIKTNVCECRMGFNPKEGLQIELNFFDASYIVKVDEKFAIKGGLLDSRFEPFVKKYQFNSALVFKKSHAKYLIPPFGSNLFSIIEKYDDFRREVTSLFLDYKLDIVFDKASQSIKILQKVEDGVFLIPYNSIADTLQRIIFYKASIISNNNCVLLFEEPEAHSFPPYMSHLTQEMIYNKSNQYFIATHSPFILNDLLENASEELSVNIVYYEDAKTSIKRLSSKEMHEIVQNGIDIFTNSESFV